MFHDHTAAILSAIDDLERVSDRHYRAREVVHASYPEGGHRLMAELEEASFWFNHRNRIIVAAMQLIPPDGLVYDVGGGNGYVSLALTRAGFQAVVIEPGPLARGIVLQRGLTLIEAGFENLHVTDGSMAGICAFDVIEHIADDAAAVRAFAAALKPGGLLYATVPSMPWLWSHEDKAAGHYRRYYLSGFRALLERNGFAMEYGTYFFAAMTAPVLALRTAPSLLGIKPGNADAKQKREHTAPGFAAGMLDAVLGGEVETVRQRKTLPIGTSCLVIARKLAP